MQKKKKSGCTNNENKNETEQKNEKKKEKDVSTSYPMAIMRVESLVKLLVLAATLRSATAADYLLGGGDDPVCWKKGQNRRIQCPEGITLEWGLPPEVQIESGVPFTVKFGMVATNFASNAYISSSTHKGTLSCEHPYLPDAAL